MNRALYPGSFDPFTNGHLSVLEKAVKIFDEVVICISTNPNKKRRFMSESSMYNIIYMLSKKDYKDKVHVYITDDPIPARIAKSLNCNYIIRGLRNDMDYNYEEGLAQYNKEFDSNIETVYFRADNAVVSSTMVYSFMTNDVDVRKYLPYIPSNLIYTDKSMYNKEYSLEDADLEYSKQVISVKARIEKETKWLLKKEV